MFPLVNSGILLSSNSFPHGHPKPVVPCMFLTYNILFDLSSGVTKSYSHLSNPLPLPGVRQTSSPPGTIGCCVPGGDPGHLAGGWEVHCNASQCIGMNRDTSRIRNLLPDVGKLRALLFLASVVGSLFDLSATNQSPSRRLRTGRL